MTHELSGALQKVGWIGQCCSLIEAYIHVRSEDIDVGERYISQACDRTPVMQKFADFVAAISHDLKPATRNIAQFTGVIFEPCIDGGIARLSVVEAQQVSVHGLSA